MEAQFLHIFVDYFGSCGIQLTNEQKSTLQTSLIILQDEMHFSKVLFWGMIQARTENYFIVEGIEKDLLDRRTLFSTDCLKWKLLEPATKETRKLSRCFNQHFTGDLLNDAEHKVLKNVPNEEEPPEGWESDTARHERLVQQANKEVEKLRAEKRKLKEQNDTRGGDGVDGGVGDEPTDNFDDDKKLNDPDDGGEGYEENDQKKSDDDDEEEEGEEPVYDDEITQVQEFNIKEADRLAAVVAEINHDTLIVPRGAFLLVSSGMVHKNAHFAGLGISDAGKLVNYYHFRHAEKKLTESLLERSAVDASYEFLDCIADDLPKGCWSLQFERGGAVVLIKSLLWPGYVFCHVPNSPIFGALYVGNGLKNIDLPFML